MSPPPRGVTPGPIGLYPAPMDPPGPLGLELKRPAPKDVISIRRFIELVEKEEARYPPAVRRNTKLMITRLRKIFYGKGSRDEYLIEDAANIKPPYQTKSVEKLRFTIEHPWWLPDQDVIGTEYSVIDPITGRSPMIAKNQEIRLVNGSYIDIGHVFAGLDAINFPQAVGYFPVKVDENVDAVTWVGDLGSVLAEVQFEALKKRRNRFLRLRSTPSSVNTPLHRTCSATSMPMRSRPNTISVRHRKA